MVGLRGLGGGGKSVRSWFGWAVPAELRVVSGDGLARLIGRAEERGFSRTAKELRPRARETYAVLPYLYEGSPEAAWMCLVVHVSDWKPPAGARPEVAFGRLDIALADFTALRRARRGQRDQLLHWTAWLASQRGTV